MKIFSLALTCFILVCLTIYFFVSDGSTNEELREGDRIPIITAMTTVGEFNEPYELRICGFGFESEKETGNNLLARFSLSLAYAKPIEIGEARKLLVAFVDSYVKKINDNSDFDRYLYKAPFTAKELKLIFFSRDPEGPFFPYIDSIELLDGIVTYETIEPDEYQFSDYEKESFEEAQRIVHEQAKAENDH